MFEITYSFINSNNVRFSSGAEEMVSSIKHKIKQLSGYQEPYCPKTLNSAQDAKLKLRPIDAMLPSHANSGACITE